ncbi:multifunctional CCA tRNA nucleotidyl transferase/2'3'-cyclic phosphodiesterase/2'nucleotidase/phosphatase [Marinobacter sp. CHS3-4]|uniref:multifunctional CCA tRNA nucleotidyl transferase/2'3'-cyclic phosphodiesterase/2'nucleotidase/phosphatase n=1 Tax=Marinobacter sp. CHS3-4 TaxID=3045174 RepID=UPI0024B5ADF4|nr:multifunctional CCA tRNA nucleotidyl transferase/2'3'-cyclic phosphodiesterase/2'nucleotidase/phosphatase [Marinobacter sp. CHS3-4]MDI9244467.1 multifunctional CCA tRNA nucleotidyl transferase/2'3'-cyclic phosphodiesterase/2'nucleotidase/phosphatase [Marinobacter sp. CHS3-4]
MKAYLVGGAVRDELLKLPVKDRDWVVTGATPGEMLQQGYKKVGADFPVFLHPESREEYALARTERKNGQGYHGFTVYSAPDVTLEDDLKRRDLTINAMAKATDGTLVDPFNGQQDLDARLLRHVSDAFAEDPLRILRTARFAARLQPMGFKVADQTMTLMKNMVAAGEVEHLVPERVWQEVQRALHENEPGTFFKVLQDCGALNALIPELEPAESLADGLNALRCSHQRDLPTEARLAALLSPLASLEPGTAEHRARSLKAPNECIAMARLVSDAVSALTAAKPLEADTLLKLLNDSDAWRKPDRFQVLLGTLACVLPSPSLANLDQLRHAYEQSASVNPQSLMAEGYAGKELGEAIQRERKHRIQLAIDRAKGNA